MDAHPTRRALTSGTAPTTLVFQVAFGYRFFVPASIFISFVVSGNCAYAAPQKQPRPPSKRPSARKTLPKEVRTACEMLYTTVAKIPGVSVRRRTGMFNDETLRQPVFGCGLAISGSFARAKETGDAALRLRESFSAHGWQEMPAYGADGTDGTSFAFRKAEVACLARGTWDGGAANDPEMPPLDWYKVVAFCTNTVLPEKRWP